jgi:Response regulator receiver domain
MGNANSSSSIEATNIALLRSVLDRYDELKVRSCTAPLTDRELYYELRPELSAAYDAVLRLPRRSSMKSIGSSSDVLHSADNRHSNSSVGGSSRQDEDHLDDGHHMRSTRSVSFGGVTSAAGGSASRESICILIVDDSHISCKLASRALETLNYSSKVALNGETALTMLRRDPAAFDLVLLDIVMPGLDGIEVSLRLLHIHVHCYSIRSADM